MPTTNVHFNGKLFTAPEQAFRKGKTAGLSSAGTQIEATIIKLNASGTFDDPIVTEITPFEKFWPAEDYHQNYVRLHPNEGYVQGVSIPRFDRFKQQLPEVLK